MEQKKSTAFTDSNLEGRDTKDKMSNFRTNYSYGTKSDMLEFEKKTKKQKQTTFATSTMEAF